MRFDPFYVSTAVSALDQASAMEQQITNEMSSGRRVNSLGDDPVASGENVLLSSQLNLDDSFSQTESSTVGMLQVADSALGSVISQMTQAISLATHANNGTMNASDLKSLATQLSSIRDEVMSLANTTYLGQYIFAGSEGGTAPFTLTPGTAPSPDTANYVGGTATSSITTPNGQQVQLIAPGSTIFTSSTNNVLQTLNQLIADFSSGTASASAVSDTTALSSALNYVSQQRVTLDNSITSLQSAGTYAQTEGTQITAAQTNLLQTDMAQASTQLSTAETQQAALTQVVNILEKDNGNLFSLL